MHGSTFAVFVLAVIARAYACASFPLVQLFSECAAVAQCADSVFGVNGIPSETLFVRLVTMAPTITVPSLPNCTTWDNDAITRALYIGIEARKIQYCSSDKFARMTPSGGVECVCPRDRTCAATTTNRLDFAVVVFVAAILIVVVAAIFYTKKNNQ
jgi:hypothetical protein